MSLQNIFHACGLNVSHCEAVHGGDINEAYCLHCDSVKYFLKINEAERYPLMFEKETKGLKALRQSCNILIPQVIQYGITGEQQYLLLEWIEPGKAKPDCMKKFGEGLAKMHQQPQDFFGWTENNYIGSLHQVNTQHNTWHSFYTECRIMPLVKKLFDEGAFSQRDILAAENFCKELEQVFPSEPPALLHGDLWSGNYMVTTNGYVAMYDPAIYFGHREMDIGMTKLFGGFDQSFYDTYNEVNPLQSGWQQRLSFTQLYPLLVHAVLFGGHYVSSVKAIISK